MLTDDERRTLEVLDPASYGMLKLYKLRNACHPNHLVPLRIRNTVHVLQKFGWLDGNNITNSGRAELNRLRAKSNESEVGDE